MGPTSRRKLIRNLRILGFEGPYSGGKHSFMVRGQLKLRIPNPHQADISIGLLAEILKQADISEEKWDRLNR